MLQAFMGASLSSRSHLVQFDQYEVVRGPNNSGFLYSAIGGLSISGLGKWLERYVCMEIVGVVVGTGAQLLLTAV